MTELLTNAWQGWRSFITVGKYPALLAGALLFLWLRGKKAERKNWLWYSAAMTICCICPVTAAALMLYQTKFYDYQWIWSFVPMTAMIAYCAASALTAPRQDGKPVGWKKGLPLAGLLLAVIFMGSGLGKVPDAVAADGGERETAQLLLTGIRQERLPESPCLWAPRCVLEYARENDGAMTLLYGRSMWDEWLGAYSYDTDTDEMRELYRWMEAADELAAQDGQALAQSGQTTAQDMQASGIRTETALRVREALGAGANCILLPAGLGRNEIERIEKLFRLKAAELPNYYLLTVQPSTSFAQ